MNKKIILAARPKIKFKWYLVIRELYLWINIFLMMFPLYYMVISAMKANAEFYNNPFAIPKDGLTTLKANLEIALSGKVGAVQLTPFLVMLKNTLFLSITTLIIMVTVATLAGYALGTRNFKGKTAFTVFILTIQTVPFFGYIMPMFLFVDRLQLTNKLFGVVPLYVAVSLPSTIILMQGFYSSFPKAIEEAALLDGCGEIRRMIYIVVPMSKGSIAAMTIVNFMGYWNEVAIASLLLKKADLQCKAEVLRSSLNT